MTDQTFENMRKLLIELHCKSEAQVLTEAQKIIDAGAQGFLLSNRSSFVSSYKQTKPNLFELAHKLKQMYPSKIIGVNPLDQTSHVALMMGKQYSFDLLWVNDGGIFPGIDSAFPCFMESGKEYYGSIHTSNNQSVDLIQQVQILQGSIKNFSLVVTSGISAGIPPHIEKIKTIKEAIGATPLVIASGMSAENVREYCPYADVFIVGISVQENGRNMFSYDTQKIKRVLKNMSLSTVSTVS